MLPVTSPKTSKTRDGSEGTRHGSAGSGRGSAVAPGASLSSHNVLILQQFLITVITAGALRRRLKLRTSPPSEGTVLSNPSTLRWPRCPGSAGSCCRPCGAHGDPQPQAVLPKCEISGRQSCWLGFPFCSASGILHTKSTWKMLRKRCR